MNEVEDVVISSSAKKSPQTIKEFDKPDEKKPEQSQCTPNTKQH